VIEFLIKLASPVSAPAENRYNGTLLRVVGKESVILIFLKCFIFCYLKTPRQLTKEFINSLAGFYSYQLASGMLTIMAP